MKLLIVLFALIAAALAVPQFYPGGYGGYGGHPGGYGGYGGHPGGFGGFGGSNAQASAGSSSFGGGFPGWGAKVGSSSFGFGQ